MIDQEILVKIEQSTELLNKARTYCETSDFNEAERCANEVLALLESESERVDLGDELDKTSQKYMVIGLLAHAYNRFTVISHTRGDLALALHQAEKAISYCDRCGHESRKAGLYINIGSVYQSLYDNTLALEYCSKALSIQERLNDKIGMAHSYMLIGSVYQKLGEYSPSLEYSFKSLAIYRELGDDRCEAIELGNIGTTYIDLSDYSLGREYLLRALAVFEKIGDIRSVAINYSNLGSLYAKPDYQSYNLEQAEEYFLKAIGIVENIGIKIYHSYKELSELYKKQERWKEHSFYFEKFYKLEKEVQSEEAKKQADRLDYERKSAKREKQLAVERAEAATVKRILHNTLPPIIADRLINNETFIADSYPNVSVLFMDLVNFTHIAAIIPPRHLIYLLNTIFSNADAVMEKHGLEKIKTIGDAYMAVAGAPVHQDDHAQRAALSALDVMEAMNNLSVIIPEELGETTWTSHVGEIQVRIGLHCGEAIGGVIGDKKFTFDLWGDAVNTAARMESYGEAGKIHVSEAFVQALSRPSDTFSHWEKEGMRAIPRDEMEIKGKGMMRTFFLERA